MTTTDDDALVLRLRGAVYNRHLLKSCGHICIDTIAQDRGKPWEGIVRIVLSEAGLIAMPSLPTPIAIVDATGLKSLMQAEKEAKERAKADARQPAADTESVISDPF